MRWTVIVKEGTGLSPTLASIRYSRWGPPTGQSYFLCKEWTEGLDLAKSNRYDYALFIKSGTLFSDWEEFVKLLENYPHQGLIGHIIWRPNEEPYLDDQCWFIDLGKFSTDDLENLPGEHLVAIRSEENLHDDYTPLWLRSGSGQQSYRGNKFGQKFIANQLNNKRIVVNWSSKMRDLKHFCYPDMDVDAVVRDKFVDYLRLAENQLWVLNNEPITIQGQARVTTPGSGLSWILNILDHRTNELQIVDISQTQIELCQHLWENWDGKDYGKIVWEFIKNKRLQHFELDDPYMSQLDRLKYRNSHRFIDYVDAKFHDVIEQYKIIDFERSWNYARKNKILKATKGNLVEWMLDHHEDFNGLWLSNILDYKWTGLNTTWESQQKFRDLCNEKRN